MVTVQELTELAKKARAEAPKRGFNQSVELFISLKDLAGKQQKFSMTETTYLPNPLSERSKVCVFATGSMALNAKRAGSDLVVDAAELDTLTANKRKARNICKGYDFFLAETSLMPKIGRILGPFLGPKGKMPMPVPPNAPIENIIARLRPAVRIRAKESLGLSCKVGDESMDDKKVGENAAEVVSAVEKKLPQGSKNLKTLGMKLSMGKPVKAKVQEGSQ